MGTTGGVAAAVRLLEAGVAALSDVDIEALSDGQQLALVRVVHPLVCRMEAQRSRVIGSVHRRGAVFADGAVSTGAWLRSRLRISDGQAQVRAAAAARQVPGFAAAAAVEAADAYRAALRLEPQAAERTFVTAGSVSSPPAHKCGRLSRCGPGAHAA